MLLVVAFQVAATDPGARSEFIEGVCIRPLFAFEGRAEVQKAGKRANTRIEQENACMELSGHRGRYRTGANAETRQMPK